MRRLLVAWVMMLLAGCAHYQPKPISASASAGALETRELDDPRLQEFVAASLSLTGNETKAVSWNLDTLSLAALYYHPDLDIARAKLASARAGIVTAGQIPNPSVDFAISYNSTTTVPSPWTAGLLVNFIVETFGKRHYRRAQAEHLAEAARDDLASATWQVRGRVRDALLELWAAQHRFTLTRQRLDRQDTLVRLIERRLAAGEASALDVMRERINHNRASLAVRDAERHAAESRARLAQSLGVPLRALEGVDISLAAFDAPIAIPPDISTGELRKNALTRRSDVQGLLAEYAAAQSALQLLVSRQFPNVKLGPGYTYDQGDHKYDLAVSSELPLFNQHQGPIAEAEAHRSEIAARFAALQGRIIAAIDTAGAGYRATSDALGTADALVAEAQRREGSIRRALEAGQLDRPALVGAQIELSAAEISRLDALAAQRSAVDSLEDALRTPLFGSKGELPVQERNPRIVPEDSR